MASPNKTSGLAVVSVCRATICSSWVKRCPPPAARGAPPAPGAGVLLSRSTGVRSFSSVQSHIRQRRCSTECPPAETPSRASGRRRLPRSRQGGVGCGRPVQRFRAERNLGENKKSAPRVPGACTRIPRILRLGPRDSPSGSVPGGWGEQGIRLERAGRVPLRPRTQRSARKCVSHSSSPHPATVSRNGGSLQTWEGTQDPRGGGECGKSRVGAQPVRGADAAPGKRPTLTASHCSGSSSYLYIKAWADVLGFELVMIRFPCHL